MNEAGHLRLAQTFDGSVRRNDRYACPFRCAPTLSYAVRTCGRVCVRDKERVRVGFRVCGCTHTCSVTDVAAVTGFIVTVLDHFYEA